MSRDLLGLVWMAVVLALFGVGLQVTTAVPSTDALLLAPDPGMGALVSLVIGLFAGLGGWLWLDEPAWVEVTEVGQRWSTSSGRRQRIRAGLLHLAGFGAAMLLWFAVGPARAVSLAPFVHAADAADLASLTCAGVGEQPSLASICRWDASRWAPVLIGTLATLLLSFGAFLTRAPQRDLIAVRIDGVGVVFERESDDASERVAWSEVLGARVTRTGIRIDLRTGEERVVPLHGMSEFERGNLVFRINGQAQLHVPERRVELDQEPRMQRMLRARE